MSGFRTYKADGSIRWDVTDRTSSVSALFALGIYNGSITVQGGGQPWWKFNNPDASENAIRPVITSSGSTIYWTWAVPGAGYNASNLTLIVGVY